MHQVKRPHREPRLPSPRRSQPSLKSPRRDNPKARSPAKARERGQPFSHTHNTHDLACPSSLQNSIAAQQPPCGRTNRSTPDTSICTFQRLVFNTDTHLSNKNMSFTGVLSARRLALSIEGRQGVQKAKAGPYHLVASLRCWILAPFMAFHRSLDWTERVCSLAQRAWHWHLRLSFSSIPQYIFHFRLLPVWLWP